MTRVRAKNISDHDVAEMVAILDGWSGKLSWGLFIEAIQKRKCAIYTRQALHKHERIKHAFSLRKKTLAKGVGVNALEAGSSELQAASQRIARLESENARLAAENTRLLEQFVRWAYNAHTRGLDKDFLSRPLPSVNRDRTTEAKSKLNITKSGVLSRERS